MSHIAYVAGLCTVFFIAAFSAGCLGNSPAHAAGASSPAPIKNIVVTEEQNGTTVSVDQETLITVKLAENPTTGFRWNLTASPGLTIINDTYIPTPVSPGIVGSGGSRIWNISPNVTGNQSISATYSRSWEPITGNETGFYLTVIVG